MARRSKRIHLAVLAALGLAAQPALAADWRVALTPPSAEPFGLSVAFIDVDTLARDGEEVRFVYEIRFQQGTDIMGMRASVRASCAAYWYEIGAFSSYVGETLTLEAGAEPRRDAAEGSNIYRVIDAACSGRFLSGTVDPVPHTRAFIAGQ